MKHSGPDSTDSGHDDRVGLDQLVTRLEDHDFRSHHPRSFSLRETSAHVNPLMLATARSDSAYVEEWRNHASRCPACRTLFEYFDHDLSD